MLLVRLADHHACTLLHGIAPPALEHRRRHHDIVDGMAAVVQFHLAGKIHGRGRGSGVGQEISRLHVV